jgi:site-specific recombinase XerD
MLASHTDTDSMTYIEEATKRAEKLIVAIRDNKDLATNTRKAVLEYGEHMKANGLTDRTINKNLYCLATFLKTIGSKDVLKLSKADIEKSMATLERSAYSAKTKQNVKITVRAFYKHLLGQDEYFPPIVRWIRTSITASKKYMPDDILTEQDIKKMLDVTGDSRDAALIAVLYDSGARVGELLNMKVKDIDLQGTPGHARLLGKTGTRIVPLIFSVPYLARYIDSYTGKKPDSPLWRKIGVWSNSTEPLDRAGVARVLEKAATRAQITKPTNPHAFRHARATWAANRLSDQQLKSYFGWTGGSRMAETYVALSARDLDDAWLEANGQPIPVQHEPVLKAIPCPKCKYENPTTASYCQRCGAPLDISIAMKMEEAQRAAISTAVNPDDIQFLVKQLVDMELEKRKKKGKN